MRVPGQRAIRPLRRGPFALSANPARRARRDLHRGQSVVEFALVLPVMVFLMLAIVDFSRIYTTMLSVESAAREAADFGTFGSQKWNDAIAEMPVDGTAAKMHLRACVASSALPDYVGPDESCTNPSFSYQLSLDKGATWVPYSSGLGCDDATREPPCWLKVTLSYDFHVITPLNLQFFGRTLGLPSTITFERSSVFAMTDLTLP
jgi:hypothetical protein